MKKHLSFLLIPISVLLLTGCPAQPEESIPEGVQKDFERVKSLSYDPTYGDKLGEAVDDGTKDAVLTNIQNQIKLSSSHVKKTSIQFDDKYSFDYEDYTNSIQEDIHVYSNDDYFTLDYYQEETKKGADDYLEIWHKDLYYNSSVKEYIDHVLSNGRHSVDVYNWKNDEQSKIEEQIGNKFKTYCLNSIATLWSGFLVFETENGYIGYSGYENDYESDGNIYYSREQNIYEIDENYQITKATEFNEQYDHYNLETKSGNLLYSFKAIYEIDYSSRVENTAGIREVEKTYSKPYIDWVTLDFKAPSEIKGDSRNYAELNVTTTHVEGCIFFDGFAMEDIEVTPLVTFATYPSLYETERSLLDRNEKLTIKGDQLRYEGDVMMFSMNSLEDALYAEVDYELDKGTLVFKGGFIEVRDKEEVKDYFYNKIGW